jgi:hypothetical protein
MKTEPIPGVKRAVWSSALVLFVAAAQWTATVVDLAPLGLPGGGRLYYVVMLFYGLISLVLNGVAILLAAIDLWAGRLGPPLAILSVFFLLWHVAFLAGAAGLGDLSSFMFYGDTILTSVYQVVMSALLVAAVVSLVRPGRWKWGMREIRRRGHGYYGADVRFPVTASYLPLSRGDRESGGDGPPPPMGDYRPRHLRTHGTRSSSVPLRQGRGRLRTVRR